jgi:hypothetical protein
MRSLFALAALFGMTALASSQEGRPRGPEQIPPRFGVGYRPKEYPQATPKEALSSVIAAADNGEFSYLVAHLLDPAFVDARLGATQSYFERVAADQIAQTLAGSALRAADLDARVRTVGLRLNVQDFTGQIRRKLADEPDHLRDLKRFARDGRFQAAGDTATATLPDVKDRALYFKKVGDRWFLENRKDERPPAKE